MSIYLAITFIRDQKIFQGRVQNDFRYFGKVFMNKAFVCGQSDLCDIKIIQTRGGFLINKVIDI